MVEEKKVFLVKVDTLKNIRDALTKTMSTKNFLVLEKQCPLQAWTND